MLKSQLFVSEIFLEPPFLDSPPMQVYCKCAFCQYMLSKRTVYQFDIFVFCSKRKAFCLRSLVLNFFCQEDLIFFRSLIPFLLSRPSSGHKKLYQRQVFCGIPEVNTGL